MLLIAFTSLQLTATFVLAHDDLWVTWLADIEIGIAGWQTEREADSQGGRKQAGRQEGMFLSTIVKEWEEKVYMGGGGPKDTPHPPQCSKG